MKSTAAFAAVLIAASLWSVTPQIAVAQDVKVETKAPANMRELLQNHVGKRVQIRLPGGNDVEGTVASVSAETVLIAKISGKDFYDAVVSINQISMVMYKAR